MKIVLWERKIKIPKAYIIIAALMGKENIRHAKIAYNPCFMGMVSEGQ